MASDTTRLAKVRALLAYLDEPDREDMLFTVAIHERKMSRKRRHRFWVHGILEQRKTCIRGLLPPGAPPGIGQRQILSVFQNVSSTDRRGVGFCRATYQQRIGSEGSN